MDAPAPPQPEPLEYAKPDADALDVTTRDDVMKIRIPPLRRAEFALRLTGWSLGLAMSGCSVAIRLLPLVPQLPRALRPWFKLPAFFPLPVAATLAVASGFMVYRIARHGRHPSLVAIDTGGIHLDHATRLIPRGHIPFERLAEVEFGTKGRDKEPSWPWHLRLMLRDGPPTMVPIPEADVPTVREAMRTAIERFCPLRADPAARAPPERGVALKVEVFYRAGGGETLDSELLRFADGIRWVVMPGGRWLFLQIILVGFLIWLTLMLADVFFAHGSIPVFTFAEWSLAYAVLIFALYGWSTPSRGGRHPSRFTIDVIGDDLILSDPDYHGRTRRWNRGAIRAIEVGGWLRWITRAGLLRVRFTDGSPVTLLYGYPTSVLRPIARELRGSLHLQNDN